MIQTNFFKRGGRGNPVPSSEIVILNGRPHVHRWQETTRYAGTSRYDCRGCPAVRYA